MSGNPEDDDDYIPEQFTGPEGRDEQGVDEADDDTEEVSS